MLSLHDFIYMLSLLHAGAVAARAEMRKESKYSHLDSAYKFIPVAIEILGAFGPKLVLF